MALIATLGLSRAILLKVIGTLSVIVTLINAGVVRLNESISIPGTLAGKLTLTFEALAPPKPFNAAY